MHTVLPHESVLCFVAVCYWVPFCSRRFHLRTSEVVLFLTIAIAIFVFCREIVLRAQFSANVFLVFFFESVCCYFNPDTVGSTLFQRGPARSTWFQLLPGSSSLFIVLECVGCTTCWKCCCQQSLVSCFPQKNVSLALSKSNFHETNKQGSLNSKEINVTATYNKPQVICKGYTRIHEGRL